MTETTINYIEELNESLGELIQSIESINSKNMISYLLSDTTLTIVLDGDDEYIVSFCENKNQIQVSSPITGDHYFEYYEDENAWLNVNTMEEMNVVIMQELENMIAFFGAI